MIKDQLTGIRSYLGPNVKLIAVSKTHPVERIVEAYKLGNVTLVRIKFKNWWQNTKRYQKTFDGI